MRIISVKRIISKCVYFFESVKLFLVGFSKKSHIIMYHRIADNKNSSYIQPGMYVFSATLQSHLLYIRQLYKTLTFDELFSKIKEGAIVDNYCVLTFDDGWLDNYLEAFPLLKKYEIPAIIFLTTNYIGTNRYFWPEELIHYLSQADDVAISKSVLFRRLVAEITIKKNDDLFYDRAVEILKKWQPLEREELLNDLRQNCHAPPLARQMMNWDEIKEMYESGLITFGAHTANHVILDQVSLAEAEREIVQSRDDIKKHLGTAPEFFAYPNGNYTPEIKELLKKHGFKAAVTTKRGRVGRDVDVFEISRVGMHEDVSNTEPMFLARMNFKWF